jgi:hypothetical protein
VRAIEQQQRGSEVVWQAAAEQITIAAPRRASKSSEATIAKATFRLTLREIDAALRDTTRRRGQPARFVALRAKAWLDKDQLRDIERHFEAINAVLRRAETARRGAAIHAVTLVLTPVRDRKAGPK